MSQEEKIPLMLGGSGSTRSMYTTIPEVNNDTRYPISTEDVELEKRALPQDDDDDEQNTIDEETKSEYIESLSAQQKQEEIREGLRTGSLFLLGLLAVGVMLVYLQFILVPLVFSRFMVYIFQPLINLFTGKKLLRFHLSFSGVLYCIFLIGKTRWPIIRRRTHLPRLLAVFIVLLLIVVLFALLGLIIFISVKQVINHSDDYLSQLKKWEDLIINWGESWGYTKEQLKSMLPTIDWSGYLVTLVAFLADLLPQMFLIVLFVVYMLLDYDATKEKTDLRRSIDQKIRRYILVPVFCDCFFVVVCFVSRWCCSLNIPPIPPPETHRYTA